MLATLALKQLWRTSGVIDLFKPISQLFQIDPEQNLQGLVMFVSNGRTRAVTSTLYLL